MAKPLESGARMSDVRQTSGISSGIRPAYGHTSAAPFVGGRRKPALWQGGSFGQFVPGCSNRMVLRRPVSAPHVREAAGAAPPEHPAEGR